MKKLLSRNFLLIIIPANIVDYSLHLYWTILKIHSPSYLKIKLSH